MAQDAAHHAQVLAGGVYIARDRSFEPAVPMGALALTPDASGCEPGQVQVNPDEDVDCVQDYVPLLGYLFWFGPLGLVFVFAMGLAIVYYQEGACGQRAWLRPPDGRRTVIGAERPARG